MITKYDDGVVEIELGHGTVKLCPGIMPDTGGKTLSFAKCDPSPVGHQFTDDVGKTVSQIRADVTVLFGSDRDIFNLIRVLTEMALAVKKT